MKTFQVLLIISIVVKSCFGGSSSYCGPFMNSFVILSQVSDKIFEISVSFFTQLSTEAPVTSTGNAYSLASKIDEILSLLSKGISRQAGLDSSYVYAVLNGHVEPPFQEPLGCFEDGLIALRDKIKFINDTVVANIRESFVAADVPPNTPCSDLQSNVMYNFSLFADRMEQKIAEFKNYISSFKDINMLDIFKNFLESQIKFDKEAVAISIAEMVGGNPNEAVAYVDGSNPQLSYPLDCVKDIIDESANLINSSYSQVVVAVQNA